MSSINPKFSAACRKFERWVLDPIDRVYADANYLQAVILASCAIEYMANADATESLAGAGETLTGFANTMGHPGATQTTSSVCFEAFCFCHLDGYSKNYQWAATLYHTVRCGLVHEFSSQDARENPAVKPLDVVFFRDSRAPIEYPGTPPAETLFVGVSHFVAAVRYSLASWESTATAAAQSAFNVKWKMDELVANSLVPGASGGAETLMRESREILVRLKSP